jgi:serine/threonine protein kinase/phage FluMu protein Com
MPFEMRCPHCNKLLRLADTLVGKRIRCPGCTQVVAAQSVAVPSVTVPSAPSAGTQESPTARFSNNRADVAQGAAVPAAEASAATKERLRETELITPVLGGYEIIEVLGRGGMGAVYLARQTSLDRQVALKVMDARKSAHPSFLARFYREAYASAQLVHHNIVQIHELGVDKGEHFYSMEYVKGESLFHLVAREGRLDPEVAVGYALQAARGLKYGHDMGMVHRDVKPENLLLNEHGIVKVADLGLVKIPYAEEIDSGPGEDGPVLAKGLNQVTRAGSAVGTPTYMAPEQARDSANVDARADIYSLGCTLYVLLTGKPPFEGRTAVEVITKHQSDPIVPPEAIVKRVPKALSAILVKMLAKIPEDRYQDMDAVIADFEKFLGLQQAGPFTPREEHIVALEQCVKDFNEAPRLRLRRQAILGFAGLCGLIFVVFLLLGWLGPAGAMVGLAILTPLIYAAVRGWREKSYLFTRTRAWALDSSWSELAYGAAGTLLFLMILYLLGLFWLWLLMGVLAVGLALTCYFVLDRPLADQRHEPVKRAEKLLRAMRLQGLEEGAVRVFVCKYAGDDWEECYEALFGYEAKRRARQWLRGETARRRNKFAAWRDPVIAWIDARQQARKEARERKLLQAVEAKALEAAGVGAAEAKSRAARVADAMVQQAAEVKKEAAAPEAASEAAPPAKLALRQLVETAQNLEAPEKGAAPPASPLKPFKAALMAVFSAPVRFLAGAALLLGWVLWLDQNQSAEEALLAKITTAIGEGNWQALDPLGEPVTLPLLPTALCELFHGFRPAFAGLILVLSAFLRGWQASLAAWLASVLMLFGPSLGIPALGPLTPELTSLAAGLCVAVIGLLVGSGKAKKPPPVLMDKDEIISWER